MVVFSKDKIKEDMVDLSKDKGKKVSVSDAVDLILKSRKSALLPVGMIRTPRLSAAGVAEAIKAVKSQNKKSRRQAKKASATRLHSLTTDQSALMALKDHINPETQNILANNWTAATSVCNWIGITCGGQPQRVTALNLSSMGVYGTIPPHIAQ
ncbi:hypothetical protein PTKIN_Ptkin05aG0216200 [Pterospermum kingtungense]